MRDEGGGEERELGRVFEGVEGKGIGGGIGGGSAIDGITLGGASIEAGGGIVIGGPAQHEAALAEDAGVDTEGVVLEGHAAELLAAHSHEVGLMIVGSRGYGPLGAVLLGGTSHSLLREAACPLIVTPRAHTES